MRDFRKTLHQKKNLSITKKIKNKMETPFYIKFPTSNNK
jgi:hypothetical protein